MSRLLTTLALLALLLAAACSGAIRPAGPDGGGGAIRPAGGDPASGDLPPLNALCGFCGELSPEARTLIWYESFAAYDACRWDAVLRDSAGVALETDYSSDHRASWQHTWESRDWTGARSATGIARSPAARAELAEETPWELSLVVRGDESRAAGEAWFDEVEVTGRFPATAFACRWRCPRPQAASLPEWLAGNAMQAGYALTARCATEPTEYSWCPAGLDTLELALEVRCEE